MAWDIFAALATEENATFTPGVGDPVTGLSVDIVKEINWQPAGESEVWETGITIEYILVDVGSEANQGDTFTADDTTVYTVHAVIENDGRFVKVAVK